MKEVTKKEFYEKIGKLDACVSSEKHTSYFKTRYGNNVLGEVVTVTENGRTVYPVQKKYYIKN